MTLTKQDVNGVYGDVSLPFIFSNIGDHGLLTVESDDPIDVTDATAPYQFRLTARYALHPTVTTAVPFDFDYIIYDPCVMNPNL